MTIHSSTVDGVTTITIENGPLNIFTPELHKELFLALKAFEGDSNSRVAILTGAGTRAFSAGDDIKRPRPDLSLQDVVRRDILPRAGDDVDEKQASWERDVMNLVRAKPIIAAINGWCVGQGFIYACRLGDIRIASPGAKFGLPEIGYGMAGAAALADILRHMPRTHAMKFALTGEPMNADEAYRCHFVNEIVGEGALLDRAREIAGQIARHPSLTLRAEMESLLYSESHDRSTTYRVVRMIDRLQRVASPGSIPENFPYSKTSTANPPAGS
jgi:enoyl-CoA hydratase/carnithine racemase